MQTKPENPPDGGEVNPSIEGDKPTVKEHVRKILKRALKPRRIAAE